jgi:hypothetical protein
MLPQATSHGQVCKSLQYGPYGVSGGTASAVSIFFRRSTKILAALTGIRHANILLEKELRGPIVKRGNLVKNPLSLSNNGLIKIGGVV